MPCDSPVSVYDLEVSGSPGAYPAVYEVWRSNELTLNLKLGPEVPSMEGIVRATCEIGFGGDSALAMVTVTEGIEDGAVLTFVFSSAQTSLPMGGAKERIFKLTARAYDALTAEDVTRQVTLLSAELKVTNDFGSGTPLEIYITVAEASEIYLRKDDSRLTAATPSKDGVMTAAQASKLAGVAPGATANATDGALRDRTTHTGEQAMATVTGLTAALASKATTDALTDEGAQRLAADTNLQTQVTGLQTSQANGRGYYATYADMAADLTPPNGKIVDVGALEPDVAKRGAYTKDGAPGAGGWVNDPSDVPSRLTQQETKTSAVRAVRNLVLGGVRQVMSFVARDGRASWSTGVDGVTRMLKVVIDSGSAVLSSLTAAGLAMKSVTNTSGWLVLVRARDGKVGLGIRDDFSIKAPGLELPPISAGYVTNAGLAAEAVSAPKLDLSLRRETANDLVPAMGDDMRVQTAHLGMWYNRWWQRLTDTPTSEVHGINDSSNTVDFRPATGKLTRGLRRINTYDPGAVGSVSYKGEITSGSAWPPSGTFATGDYYTYTSAFASPRVIGSDTVRLGDNMVWNGSAWVYQAAPGSGVARAELDWWSVSAGGTFAGIVLTTGDPLVYLGYQSNAGTGWERWRKGRPADGEFFRCGTFNPSGGLPASPAPVDGDLWEASAAGTTGGFTFAIGDTLYRYSGVWGRVASGAIQSFAAGAVISLPCHANANEWEIRRGDSGSTFIMINLRARGIPIARRGNNGILVQGDSMAGQPGPALALLLPARTVTTRSDGGGTARNIVSTFEYNISNGDPDRGKTVITFIGQNSAGFLGQNMQARARITAACGTADRRVIHVSMLGTRIMTFNGTRLVCANLEEQRVTGSSNSYARDVAALRATYPDQWMWASQNLCDAAAADNEPSIQFPGMTNAQVAAAYGIWPVKYCRGFDLSGVNLGALNFLGYHSAAGNPAGGTDNDYYLRTGNGTIGNPIFKIGGSWTERAVSDNVHLSQAGDAIQAAGLAAILAAKGW